MGWRSLGKELACKGLLGANLVELDAQQWATVSSFGSVADTYFVYSYQLESVNYLVLRHYVI